MHDGARFNRTFLAVTSPFTLRHLSWLLAAFAVNGVNSSVGTYESAGTR